MLKAITKKSEITGKPVSIAKTIGKPKPGDAGNIIGISTTKNKAQLYKQNAKANKKPNTNEPNRPLS